MWLAALRCMSYRSRFSCNARAASGAPLANPALLPANAADFGSVRSADAFHLSVRSRTRFR